MNTTIFKPGTWVNIKFTLKETIKAYYNTEWKNKNTKTIYLEFYTAPSHEVGYIKNVKINQKGEITCTPIISKETLHKHKVHKLKLKIMPTIIGGYITPQTKEMKNFTFTSMGLTRYPGIKNIK